VSDSNVKTQHLIMRKAIQIDKLDATRFQISDNEQIQKKLL